MFPLFFRLRAKHYISIKMFHLKCFSSREWCFSSRAVIAEGFVSLICRLADVVNGFSALFFGSVVSFYFGPKMAPVGISTALGLMSMQTLAAQYLKFRMAKDSKMAEEPSRVCFALLE